MHVRCPRFGAVLSWLCVLLSAVVVAGCAAPEFTYVADSSASTYFKVPSGWHKIDNASLTATLSAINSSFGTPSGLWDAGYDAAGAPSARDARSPAASEPFALALVVPLSSTATNAMSYNLLRDFLLPVTSTSRQAAARSAFPLTGFRLLSDNLIAAGQGIHGVRVIFDYTYPGGRTNTFDQVALTNSDATTVYLLLVHCLAACYSQHFSEINTVMTSFTVRSQ